MGIQTMNNLQQVHYPFQLHPLRIRPFLFRCISLSAFLRVNNNSETRAILNYKWPEPLEQVAFTRQAFNLIRNGNIISRGYIVIQEDSGDFLSCFFLSGNSNWINQLKGVITDLEWVNYSTKIDVTNVRNITASSGIVFPMVDWAYNLQQGYNARFLVGGGLVS